jgi:hypothetical protein
MTLQLRIPSRQPSEELLNLIKEVGNIGTKLSELFEAVKQKGHEEGFTDYEIRDMLRTHLKGSLSAGQIKWYLYEKDKYDLRKQLAGSSQVEDNKVIEQNTKDIELRSRTKVQDVAIIPNNITSNIVETTTVELDQEKEQLQTESVRDLKATIEHQAQYINTLEDKIQEKQEIQKLQGQLRIKISISQLYRDVLMMRNSGVTYTHIIIDNDKYIKLEGI